MVDGADVVAPHDLLQLWMLVQSRTSNGPSSRLGRPGWASRGGMRMSEATT